MFLKRLFISDTRGKTSAPHIHCSGLLGDIVLSHSPRGHGLTLYKGFSGKMVLKSSFFHDTGKTLASSIHCLGLLRDRSLSHSPRRELPVKMIV